MGSEPVLCRGDGKVFVLRIKSQDLITDGTRRWVIARRRGAEMPTALAELLQPMTAQVAEEQGGCCHWS